MVSVTPSNAYAGLAPSSLSSPISPVEDRPLNILQIVPSISLIYGGPSQMVRGFSQALAKQEANVTILTTDSNGDNGQAPLDVPLNQPVAQDDYHVRYFHCSPFRRYKFSLGLMRWLYQHAHEFDIAHIHALFSPVSSCAAAIARYRRLPYILRPLGTLDPADLHKKRQLKQIYAALLEKPNIAGAAGLHFTSPQENQVSERFGTQTPGFVIPLGVNPPPPARPKTEGRGPKSIPTILFMSRIDPKKGLDLLIPALENLLANGQDFHFVLAGSNPQDPVYEMEVRDRIQASPLAACTTIPGFVQGEAKQALLQQADIFVLPSYYENFGIAVAEAMAANLPVVISDQVHI
ncbi:MAG: hormogonium polysaccharide biosynthesis glycosyltransferase HpsP, partial [Leptolyngbyaceae cyanobacterium]